MSDEFPPVTQTGLTRLPTDLRTLYTTQYNYWNTQLTALQTQLTALMASPVESYSFAGGQGNQSAKRRDLEQVQRAVKFAESQVTYYWRKLNGYGIVNVGLRRR